MPQNVFFLVGGNLVIVKLSGRIFTCQFADAEFWKFVVLLLLEQSLPVQIHYVQFVAFGSAMAPKFRVDCIVQRPLLHAAI